MNDLLTVKSKNKCPVHEVKAGKNAQAPKCAFNNEWFYTACADEDDYNFMFRNVWSRCTL